MIDAGIDALQRKLINRYILHKDYPNVKSNEELVEKVKQEMFSKYIKNISITS